MFIDYAKIFLKSGKGGDGRVSFHTAKYVPNGGPDGGDGGDGGSVIFVADANLSTLQDFRYKRKYMAEDGEMGGRRNKTGKNGADLYVKVPVGTIIKDAQTGRLLADFTANGEEVVIAEGGKGGKGNVRFANPVRQAPNFARAGEAATEMEVIIELKLLADIGLIGMPNVGKSTLLSVVSEARPAIADYHFTTLEPNLGICTVGEKHFAIADIPGLIEGASDGLGLGHNFLRHIERTRLLLHLVDVSGSEGRDPLDDFKQINNELAKFDSDLAKRHQLVVASKIDLATEAQLKSFHTAIEGQGYEVFDICGPIHEGVNKLMQRAAALLDELPETVLRPQPELATKIYTYDAQLFNIKAVPGGFAVVGKWAENLVNSTNFEDVESLQYFQRLLKTKGVIDALVAAGIKEGDTVHIYDIEFEYVP
ncbi:GTPase ObgE [Mageeibacillus indolicus]|uniref:GTPase ObgE n=1 Tax=Mageeibacillus indolicus TaxID=884684 RepID=UPI0004DCDA1A|nr:GTPase ObgE [Mageeibacillus indolicus]KFA57585.1 GTPase [Mageeibacillus indolicus 0009-5]